MTVEELIGLNVRLARQRIGMTQERLGRELHRYLGRSWSPQSISQAEKGLRSFRAVELLALSEVLGTSPGALLTSLERDAVFPTGVIPRVGLLGGMRPAGVLIEPGEAERLVLRIVSIFRDLRDLVS